MIALTQQLLVTATTEAARYGAQATVDNTIGSAANSAAKAAEAYLFAQGLELFASDPNAAEGRMLVERRVGMGAVESVMVGDGPPCPAATLPTKPMEPDQLRVTICFPLVDASDPSGVGNPVGNWLNNFGFDLSGSVIHYTSVANLE